MQENILKNNTHSYLYSF